MQSRRLWYEVLGVQPDASDEIVRRRYLALVRAWHPDRFQDHQERAAVAEERLKEINFAYDQAKAFHRLGDVGFDDIAAGGYRATRSPYGPPAGEWWEFDEPDEPRIRLIPPRTSWAVRAVALALAVLWAFLTIVRWLPPRRSAAPRPIPYTAPARR
jgi:hypothetical protein